MDLLSKLPTCLLIGTKHHRKEVSMKKAIIYYFTGTGNTRYAAEEIQKALNEKGFETTLFDIRKPLIDAPDPNHFDISGFGYPIHAFNPPQLFLKIIKSLPRLHTPKNAFLFRTAGEPFFLNNASSWSVLRALKQKGFSVLMDQLLLMPYNILFRYDDRLAKQMLLHTQKMAKLIADDVDKSKMTKRIIYPWIWLVMMIFRGIQWYGAKINGPLFHVKKDKCIQCKTCQKLCPSENITFKDGYPKFSIDCSMCMACVMYCPKDAIRPGLITPIRVNGSYSFSKLLQDEEISSDFINSETKGYFKGFLDYYEKTEEIIQSLEEESA